MASLHTTSSVTTRSRAARVPLNTSKPVSLSARAPSAVSAPSPLTAPSTTSSSTVSHLSLFLTNLRLLDLDLHPDWPDISAATFSSRDAAQGQKKRIHCVEWALYHLFVLWDHDEARDKLQPFFPPLDQVQSLNLRAALLRCLEHAKKNGVLGRDAVVRKTMLDECKGERLEEVLAAFSSAVLKKLVAGQQLNDPQVPALAQGLALENRGYSGERTELVTLILAHKASLRRALDKKNAARARYKEFSLAMDVKERSLANRRAEAKALQSSGKGSDVSNDVKLDVWRTVRNNWSGNEKWMETLLYGDHHSRKDGLLSTPFDRVWRRVEAGRLSELEDKSGGLLEQLDSRVKSQKDRLEKWQDFRQRLVGKNSGEPNTAAPPQPKQKGVDLGFRAHETLHLGRMSPRKLPRAKPHEVQGEYDELISSLQTELADITSQGSQIPAFFQQATEATRRDLGGSDSEAVSDISDIENELIPPQPPPRQRTPVKSLDPVLRRTKTLHEHTYFSGEQEVSPIRRSATIQTRNPTSRRPPSLSPTRSPERRHSPPIHSPDRPIYSPQRSVQRSPPRPIHNSPPRIHYSPPRLPSPPIPTHRTPSPERPISPTQFLADQILASVRDASPSPLKKPRHTLSLAERTRLSMARRTSQVALNAQYENDPDEFEPEPETPRQRQAPIVSIDPPDYHSNGDSNGGGGYEDLVSRTRRSMAGFEAAQKKAQLERRRSLRKSKQVPVPPRGRDSYFPAVDEEGGNTTLLLAEELMNVEDQDAVFMSRPKIKTSPVGTPIRGWGGPEYD
ncbi:hypothetical protein OQA88_13134 [Cercophora sp. LCS_1]